ncbi:MAG: hypothetical protein AAF548_01770 [Actinomycetota bacterium]
MRRLLQATLALALGVAVLAAAAPAHAGGSWFASTEDSYAPGDRVTMIGYTGGGAYGWIEDGPFFAWLTGNSGWTDEEGVDPAYMHYLGPITLHENATSDGDLVFFRVRMSITFDLPGDLEPGIYGFNYCNAACDEQMGDLIGGSVYVGVERDYDTAWFEGWEPHLTGEPLPAKLTLIDDAPDPGFVPPEPSDIWFTGHIEPTGTTLVPSTTTTSTTTTSTTTTVPAAAAVDDAAPPAGGEPQAASASTLGDGARIALAGLMIGAMLLVAVTARRRPAVA